MVQHQQTVVKDQPQSLAPQAECACGKRIGSTCDFPNCTKRTIRPEGDGLGVAPHRRSGRRTAAILSNVWERAVRTFGLTEQEIVDALEVERNRAEAEQAKRNEVQAELDAGAAAFLAGIDINDAILSKLARQGWEAAERNFKRGWLLGYDDVMEISPSHPSRSLRKGWEAGQSAKSQESMVTL